MKPDTNKAWPARPGNGHGQPPVAFRPQPPPVYRPQAAQRAATPGIGRVGFRSSPGSPTPLPPPPPPFVNRPQPPPVYRPQAAQRATAPANVSAGPILPRVAWPTPVQPTPVQPTPAHVRPRPTVNAARRVLQPRFAPAQPARRAVVQRDVGFEFEMNWAVIAPSNTIGMDTAIMQGTGWHAEPDMKPLPQALIQGGHYGGYGNLEFITDAFPETANGRFGLAFAVNEIVGLVCRIGSSWYSLSGWGQVRLADFIAHPIAWGPVTANLPNERKRDIWIDRKDSAGTASPQMSAGIRLEKVADVIGLMGAPAINQPDLYGRQVVNSQARTRLTNVVGRAQTQSQARNATFANADEQARYKGALAHLGSILELASLAQNVEKTKYLHPLLSRTNFGLLPAGIRNHANLIEDVIIASGLGNAITWNNVLNHQLFPNSQNLSTQTVGQWLNAVIAGNDPLNWGQTGNLARWNPAVVGPVGHQSQGHVYEFRGIQPGGLPVDRWLSWALDRFDYVRNTLNQ